MKPDFPSLADEVAEPHPDMNIKVAAFTVSEKPNNIVCFLAFNTTLAVGLPIRQATNCGTRTDSDCIKSSLKLTKTLYTFPGNVKVHSIECYYLVILAQHMHRLLSIQYSTW